MKDLKAKKITQKQFIRSFKASKNEQSKIRFGFILGAGASVNSGIKAGGYFAKKWYEEIKEDVGLDALKDFDENNLAQNYTEIFEKRFEANYEEGYEELQGHMDKAKPSIGYSFLAQILNETHNKFIITTNFDTMTEDALFEFKKARPLVLGHEFLSQFVNTIAPTRPTIIKIHRDFLLDPYNRAVDIEDLDSQWKEALQPVLKENAMVVLGYGGNDKSLMDYLKDIDVKDRKPIYWCCRDKENLSENIKELLSENDYVIEINGFDKFMLLLNDGLEFEHLTDKDNIENSQIVKNALKFANEHKKQLEELVKNDDLDDDEKEALTKQLPSWWAYQIKINKEKNIDKKEKIFLEGLMAFEKSHELMGNYANLLSDIKNDYDEAEKYYKKALELEPNHANINGNYAVFLSNIKNNYDEAEKYYKKVLELEPNHANNNGNYALFLSNIKNDYDEAEKYYKKALELEPNHANNNGNYASFLLSQGRKDESSTFLDNAFEYHKNENENDLYLELWFYRLAHFPEYFDEAQKELDKFLAKGVKSIGWDFSQNIQRAKLDGFKDIELLESYAKKISTNE